MTESALARLEVLERFDQDHTHGERSRSGSPANVPILPKEEANRSLYKILESTLMRISVLEKRRDISYLNAFKASNGTECFIRGCGGEFPNTLPRIRTTSTPERQVAAIILNQTECLECNKRWKTASGLIHHEMTVHKEAYTSRIDLFRPFFEQGSRTCLAPRIRNDLTNQLQILRVQIIQHSHQNPNLMILPPTTPFTEAQPFFLLQLLILTTPCPPLAPKLSIFHRLLSVARSRSRPISTNFQ